MKDQLLLNTPGIQVYEFDVNAPKTGTKRQLIFHKAILEKPDGQVGGLVGAILDITERKNSGGQRAAH